jgi:hypothetical protein
MSAKTTFVDSSESCGFLQRVSGISLLARLALVNDDSINTLLPQYVRDL